MSAGRDQREQCHQSAPAVRQPAVNQIMELQRLAGNRAVGALLSRRSPLSVQRFEADEHMWLGDRGAPRSKAQMLPLAVDYQITFGEMVAMAGDHFDTPEQMKEFAAKPGPGAGTREEIEYVRVVHVHGEKDKAGTFSSAAKTAADNRYLQLAIKNRSHFLNPEGKPGSTADRAEGAHDELRVRWDNSRFAVERELVLPRAGAGYRHYHFEALRTAYQAGRTLRPVDDAMVLEAFACHFLTDAFSAGHLRTPRSAGREYWNAKVPMFYRNLKGFLIETLAKAIGDAHWHITRSAAMRGIKFGLPNLNWKPVHGTADQVSAMLDAKAPLAFGDVVSGVIHDYDNVNGVEAVVDGKRERLYGDGQLHDPILGGGATKRLAAQAVDISRADVTRAWQIGQQNGDVTDVLPAVTKGQLFGAEHMLPEPVPDSQLAADDQSIQWQVGSAEDLLNDPKFLTGLAVFGVNKASELAAIIPDLPELARPHFSRLVVEAFRTQPRKVLLEVLNWTPDIDEFMGGLDVDDDALAYYDEVRAANAVGTLTVKQRLKLIEDLLGGYVAGDEEDAIFDLVTANPAHSQQVITKIGWGRLENDLGDRFAQRFPKAG